jgi:MscS family membrane protein
MKCARNIFCAHFCFKTVSFLAEKPFFLSKLTAIPQTSPMDLRTILRTEFLNNTVENYVWFVGILLFGYLFKAFVSKLVSEIMFRLLKKYSQDATKFDFKRLLIQPLEFLTFLFFLYLAFDRLNFPKLHLPRKEIIYWSRILLRVYRTFLIISLTWVTLRLVDFIGLVFMKRAEKTISKMDDQLVPFFKDFAKVIVVIIGFLFMISFVFDQKVSKIIAGLGIGGLALAFAAKESLENLLASFTIFLDQPFIVGDLVQVGEITGVVEKIGFRSTRIRTLEKSYVTVPNKNMIDKPLDNLTLRTFRRAKFDVKLTYNATSAQIKNIVTDIQQFVDEHPRTNQEGRVRFMNLGDSSKDIMVQYFVDTMDWDEYIDTKQEINFKIVKIVEDHGADFAFPTTTIHLVKEPKADLGPKPKNQ